MDFDLELIIPDLGNIWKIHFCNLSFPGSTGNVALLFSTILEILEIEVSTILCNPENIGLFNFLLSWKCWKLKSSAFSIILEIRAAGWRVAPPARFSWLRLVLEHWSWKSVTALENKYYCTILKVWFSRPNHYAHGICVEILCRAPVSILKYLSPRPQNHMKKFKYSSLA